MPRGIYPRAAMIGSARPGDTQAGASRQVAAGPAETQNACGADVRPPAMAAVGNEAGTPVLQGEEEVNDQGWMVDDGTCSSCVRGQCWRCTKPVEDGGDQWDPRVSLVCCCNEGYHIGYAAPPEGEP